MTNFAANILPGSIADAVGGFAKHSPLLGSGVSALAARWAMRSGPAALALVGAGLLYSYLRRDRTAKLASASRRAPASRSKARPRKAAKSPNTATA